MPVKKNYLDYNKIKNRYQVRSINGINNYSFKVDTRTFYVTHEDIDEWDYEAGICKEDWWVALLQEKKLNRKNDYVNAGKSGKKLRDIMHKRRKRKKRWF